MSNVVLLIIFSILLLPGLLGVILPIPGVAYMFLTALVYGFIDHFQHLTWQNLIVLGVLLVASVVSDAVSGIAGAKYGGASKRSIIVGTIGLIIGLFLLPPFGGLIGLFLGVLLSEVAANSSRKKALTAASGSLLGSVIGMVISLILSLIFIVLFIVFAAK